MANNLRTRGEKAFAVFNYIFMTLLCIICVYPLWYVLVSSVSDPVQLYMQRGIMIWPLGEWSMRGYQLVMENPNIPVGFGNTLIYLGVGTFLNMFITIMAAYGLSRKGCYWNGKIMKLIAFTMYFGGGLIPTYLIVKKVGLLNRAYTLIVLGSVSVYNIIVTRSFFQSTLPDSLFESARIDGASELRMFFSIALPLSGSIIAVMALYYGVGRWNEFFNALIYVSNVDYQPLQLVLRSLLLQSQQAVMDAALTDDPEMLADAARLAYMAEAMKYAIIFIAAAPLLIAYPFVQKHFVRGVMIGALKG